MWGKTGQWQNYIYILYYISTLDRWPLGKKKNEKKKSKLSLYAAEKKKKKKDDLNKFKLIGRNLDWLDQKKKKSNSNGM